MLSLHAISRTSIFMVLFVKFILCLISFDTYAIKLAYENAFTLNDQTISTSFINPEQKQVLCQHPKHIALIVMQRSECKAFFDSGKLASVFKIESHIKSLNASSQAIQKLNYVLHLHYKSNALRKAALHSEAIMQIDQVCDLALHEGFAIGMIVHGATELVKIEDIQVGDLVCAQDLENDLQVMCPVTHICKEIIPCYVEIKLTNETIITALGQKFHLEGLGWKTAQDLIHTPELQAHFPEPILEIRQVNQSIEVYKLTVAHEHNFYVTEKQLLAHNFIPMVTVVGVAVPSILIPIAKGIGAAAFGWVGSMFLKSLAPSKKECDRARERYHEQHSKEKYDTCIPDKQPKPTLGGCLLDEPSKKLPNSCLHEKRDDSQKDKLNNKKDQSALNDDKKNLIGCGNNVGSKDQHRLNNSKKSYNNDYKKSGENHKNKDNSHNNPQPSGIQLEEGKPKPQEKKPEKNDQIKEHPNGIYEGAPYHHQKSKGKKSPAPKDGQKALDNSIPLDEDGKTPRRLSVEGENFVVFDQTSKGKFHGHIRSRDELKGPMRTRLIKEGFTNNKGKIIK